MVDLSGKFAVITGAASGIGRATATLFAERGARVLAVDRPESAIMTAHAGNDAVSVLAKSIADDDAPGPTTEPESSALTGIKPPDARDR